MKWNEPKDRLPGDHNKVLITRDIISKPILCEFYYNNDRIAKFKDINTGNDLSVNEVYRWVPYEVFKSRTKDIIADYKESMKALGLPEDLI